MLTQRGFRIGLVMAGGLGLLGAGAALFWRATAPGPSSAYPEPPPPRVYALATTPKPPAPASVPTANVRPSTLSDDRAEALEPAATAAEDVPASQREVGSVAAILKSQDLPDAWMVQQFFNLVTNPHCTEAERLESLNEGLNRVQIGEEAPLIALARDARLTPALMARLVAEAESRNIDYRFDLNFIFLGNADPGVRQAARKQLTELLDQDYGEMPTAWVAPGQAAKKVWAE
jgi:hypothetical protein